MVIKTNISAIAAYNSNSSNQDKVTNSLRKLSSGSRINSSKDDASGLAISEQMKSKINGLDQAIANAKDAKGIIETAEGALKETHSILQRMVTLSTQAANGTYATSGSTDAREALQKEMDELAMEMERIARTTDYNGVKPLNTSDGGTKMTMQVGPTASETLTIGKYDMSYGALIQQYTSDYETGRSNYTTSAYSITARATILGSTVSFLAQSSITMKFENGTTADTVTIHSMDMGTVSHANASIKAINSAINRVSLYRAELGAKANRLEHTISNLTATEENVTSAESRIADTDMAKEISKYTQNNILMQAAQSMLAQANQQPQNVLSMLG